jgi:hypothetical protein
MILIRNKPETVLHANFFLRTLILRISKTETPDNAKYSEKEDNQTFGLIYPGDIVQSLIVHVEF